MSKLWLRFFLLLSAISLAFGSNLIAGVDYENSLGDSDIRKEGRGRAKIYDCFLFLNEYEVLDIHLAELYPVVDKFVIIECVETFKGHPKPLNFIAHIDLYKKYIDKIIYVPVFELLEITDPWEREFFQRDQIMKGLFECRDHDLVIIEDCDEILRPLAIKMMKQKIQKQESPCIVGWQHMYHFF
ncbi:MAG: hypothetical protein JJU12_03835 [Chlamydiales bacterium]|nr:hypothetical protein [Chlamydiales bacterium]